MTIKGIREATGLNQTDFAKKFNIPLRTYQSWEIGERKPAPYIVRMIEKNIELEKEIKMLKTKIYTANKETGDFIEEVKSVEEGIELIRKYEDSDKAEGIYEEDFYDVVDQDHMSLI